MGLGAVGFSVVAFFHRAFIATVLQKKIKTDSSRRSKPGRGRSASRAHLKQRLNVALDLSGDMVVVQIKNFNRTVRLERLLKREGTLIGNAIVPEVYFLECLAVFDQISYSTSTRITNLVAAQVQVQDGLVALQSLTDDSGAVFPDLLVKEHCAGALEEV